MRRTRVALAAGWFAGALLLTAGTAGAQLDGPLDVDRAVALALAANPAYLQQAASVGIAEGSQRSALGNILPGFNGSWTYNKSSGTNTVFEFPVRQTVNPQTGQFVTLETAEIGLDNESNTNNFGLSVSQNISLSSWLNYRSAAHTSRNARLGLEAAAQDLVYSVRSQFYLTLRAQDLLQVQELDYQLAVDQEERITSMFELGSVARADVLKAKVRVSEAELALIQQRNAVAIEKTRLATLLGLPADSKVELAGSLNPTPVVVDSARAAADAEGRPDLMASRASVDGGAAQAKAATLSWLPGLFASFDVNTTSGTSKRDQIRSRVDPNDASVLVNFPAPEDSRIGNDGWTFRVGASVNLDAFFNTGEMKRAKSEQRRREHAHDGLELQVQQELEEAILNYRASVQGLAAAEDAVVSAEEDLRLSQERYQQGLGTVLELLEAQVALTRARNTRVNAQTGLKISEAALDKARGAPVPLH